eukprot:g8769.t1
MTMSAASSAAPAAAPTPGRTTSLVFGYLGVTLLVSFQGQLVVLDYLHNGPFRGGTWAETSVLVIAATQCFAGPLFTALQKKSGPSPQKLFRFAAGCILSCNLVFVSLLAFAISPPDGNGRRGSNVDKLVGTAYAALVLLGLGQNFFMSVCLAVAATWDTPEAAQHAFSRGSAVSGLPGLVFMWAFGGGGGGGGMALVVFVGCTVAVGAAIWLGERYLFAAAGEPPLTRRSRGVLNDSDAPHEHNGHDGTDCGQQVEGGPRLSRPFREASAVFGKTWRVVVGVFLLFTFLHLLWPAVVLAVWPANEEEDPDRIEFRVLLTTFILADVLARFGTGRKSSHPPPEFTAEAEEALPGKQYLRAAQVGAANGEDSITSCKKMGESASPAAPEELRSLEAQNCPQDTSTRTRCSKTGSTTFLSATSKQHHNYSDSSFLTLVLLYGATVLPTGIFLAVVEIPSAVSFLIKAIAVFFFASVWGHLGSAAYVLGPALVQTKREKDLAGPMVGHALVVGIFVGTLMLRFGTLELLQALE